ncbi:hypothetical protein PR048_010425 [Dryococelus australis]|uniref:Uncharacterized protein n=1 Tax=Dryococelus australis TaxID=614101 RepID=A0ABQ9I3J7_9NEOP|nr:hypothetical protein PR048_010425 [Dryococelus australis]
MGADFAPGCRRTVLGWTTQDDAEGRWRFRCSPFSSGTRTHTHTPLSVVPAGLITRLLAQRGSGNPGSWGVSQACSRSPGISSHMTRARESTADELLRTAVDGLSGGGGREVYDRPHSKPLDFTRQSVPWLLWPTGISASLRRRGRMRDEHPKRLRDAQATLGVGRRIRIRGSRHLVSNPTTILDAIDLSPPTRVTLDLDAEDLIMQMRILETRGLVWSASFDKLDNLESEGVGPEFVRKTCDLHSPSPNTRKIENDSSRDLNRYVINIQFTRGIWGHGGRTIRLLASHQGEPAARSNVATTNVVERIVPTSHVPVHSPHHTRCPVICFAATITRASRFSPVNTGVFILAEECSAIAEATTSGWSDRTSCCWCREAGLSSREQINLGSRLRGETACAQLKLHETLSTSEQTHTLGSRFKFQLVRGKVEYLPREFTASSPHHWQLQHPPSFPDVKTEIEPAGIVFLYKTKVVQRHNKVAAQCVAKFDKALGTISPLRAKSITTCSVPVIPQEPWNLAATLAFYWTRNCSRVRRGAVDCGTAVMFGITQSSQGPYSGQVVGRRNIPGSSEVSQMTAGTGRVGFLARKCESFAAFSACELQLFVNKHGFRPSFFLYEPIVIGIPYLDMLPEWLFPQFEEAAGDLIFQQDGAPPHWHLASRGYLSEMLPQRWIGRGAVGDQALHHWPPRSPDLTPCDFFLWGYIKDQVFRPPLPANIDDLKSRITEAIQTVTPDMLTIVWTGTSLSVA